MLGCAALRGMSRPQPGAARPEVVSSFYLALLLVGLAWHAVVTENNDVWRAHDDVGVLALALGPLLGLAVGLGVVAGFRALELRMPWIPELHREFRAVLGPLTTKEIVILAGASALGEEVFFRGAMLDAWGLGISSVVFALLHIPPRRALWPWTLSAGLMGLVFGGLTLITDSLGAAVAAHFAINLINLAYISRHSPAVVVTGPVQPSP